MLSFGSICWICSDAILLYKIQKHKKIKSVSRGDTSLKRARKMRSKSIRKWDYRWHFLIPPKMILATRGLSERKSSKVLKILKIWSKMKLFDEFERNHVYKLLFTFVLKDKIFKILGFHVKQYRLRNCFEIHVKINHLCLLSGRPMGRIGGFRLISDVSKNPWFRGPRRSICLSTKWKTEIFYA